MSETYLKNNSPCFPGRFRLAGMFQDQTKRLEIFNILSSRLGVLQSRHFEIHVGLWLIL